MGYEFAVASDQTTTTPVTEPVDKARPADAQDLIGNDEIKRRMEASGTVDDAFGSLPVALFQCTWVHLCAAQVGATEIGSIKPTTTQVCPA